MWLERGGTDGWIVDKGGWVLRANGDQLTRQLPLPSVEAPLDVTAAGPNAVFIVGAGGAVDRWSGERQRVDYPAFSFASAVFAASGDDVLVGDVQGRVWRREGAAWRATQAADAAVSALWRSPEDEVWAGGGNSWFGDAPFLARVRVGEADGADRETRQLARGAREGRRAYGRVQHRP